MAFALLLALTGQLLSPAAFADAFTHTAANTSDVSHANTTNEKIGVKQLQQAALDYARNHLPDQYGIDNKNGRLEFQAVNMDSRLAMRQCRQPLAFEAQNSNARSGRLLVKVLCQDEQPWSIFIPLQVTQWRQVVTTTRLVQRNEVLRASDLVIREQALEQLNMPHLESLEDAIGKLALRPIPAGSPLNARLLGKPRLVKRGDSVMITASANGISARMPGTAMADGREDDEIRVKNQRSQRIIKARVVGPGEVAAAM